MRWFRFSTWLLLIAAAATFGCRTPQQPAQPVSPYFQDVATRISYPSVESLSRPLLPAQPPRALENPHDLPAWELTLNDAVETALRHSEIVRSIGGNVVSGNAASVYDPALTETGRQGVETALSAFDAQLATSLFWFRNDRPINQTFPGLFLPTFGQTLGRFESSLSKTTAAGTRLAIRHHVNYDRNSNPSNRFPSSYDIDYELEARQPLLQGSGVNFNRIAGPNATPGAYGGVLLARINSDVSLADFEAAVINLVSEIEDAYWELYFSYRDLQAKIAGRDSALATWRNIEERLRANLPGFRLRDEAQARSQYFLFRGQVEEALSGSGGLFAAEQRLRYLLGLPPNGERLIRPASEPGQARVVFAWNDAVAEAFDRRVELRRQKWQIQRRQFELTAARNFLLPRLDAVALYRWRGLGDQLIGPRKPGGDDNAYQMLTSGDFQEWQLGFELSLPIGFRQQFVAVRNAQLALLRERSLLAEQELRVSHDLSNALRSAERAFQLIITNFNRRVAAQSEVEVLRAEFTEQIRDTRLDLLLQAQQRLAEADSAYHRALIDHALAIKNIHREKGSLLDYDGVLLAEGPWTLDAYRDAFERSRHFASPRHHRPAGPPLNE